MIIASDMFVQTIGLEPYIRQSKRASFVFRGQEVFYQKPWHIDKRIIFLGDSGTYGIHVPKQGTFPALFESSLARGVRNRTEVINAGVIGFTTVQEYHFLKDKLLDFKPDIVVLAIYMANDINFNAEHNEQLIKKNTFGFYLTKMRTHSALLNFVYYRTLALREKRASVRSEDDYSESKRIDPRVKEYDLNIIHYVFGEIALYLRHEPPSITEAYSVTEEILLRIKELSLIHDFQFVITLIPTASTITNSVLIPIDTRALGKPIAEVLREKEIDPETDLDLMRPTNKILAICKKLKVLCINPLEAMKEIGQKAINVELRDDHPSAAGNVILASELIKHFDQEQVHFVDP